jgi:hypothetical protein
MSRPLLSILIPTVTNRLVACDKLVNNIISLVDDSWTNGCRIGLMESHIDYYYFNNNPIEIITCRDEKQLTIGEKRESLYIVANGLYSWQIDDDDDIASDAIELIIEAIKQEPDCITFQEHCMINGVHYKSNHSLTYGDWEGDGQKELSDGFHFHRTPFMKSVIKTEIARSVPVPHIRFGEDHQWSQALKPLLKTELHIPQDIYFYQHTSTDFNTRYGIKD